jgi:hypothetical protein
MSTRIYGPLEPYEADRYSHWTGVQAAPPAGLVCPQCGQDLVVVAAALFSGIHCGIEFVLECEHGHKYRWDSGDSFETEAYGGQP